MNTMNTMLSWTLHAMASKLHGKWRERTTTTKNNNNSNNYSGLPHTQWQRNEKWCRHAGLHKKGIKQTISLLIWTMYIHRQTSRRFFFRVFISAPCDRHKAVTNNDMGNKTSKQKYIESFEHIKTPTAMVDIAPWKWKCSRCSPSVLSWLVRWCVFIRSRNTPDYIISKNVNVTAIHECLCAPFEIKRNWNCLMATQKLMACETKWNDLFMNSREAIFNYTFD